MAHFRSQETVDSALRMSDDGVSDKTNAEIHGVAIKTIRRWRRLYQRRALTRGTVYLGTPCPLCDGAELDESAYALLLGWYLGDGHIAKARRGVYVLSISNDPEVPGPQPGDRSHDATGETYRQSLPAERSRDPDRGAVEALAMPLPAAWARAEA